MTVCRLTKLLLLSLTGSALAGEAIPLPDEVPKDLGTTYRNLGKIYFQPENPWLQSLAFVNRFHYNFAHLIGTDFDRKDFTYQTHEIRRFRSGVRMSFLKHFELVSTASILINQQSIGGTNISDFRLWDGYLNFDIRQAFALEIFDRLQAGYGKGNAVMGAEWDSSSNTMKVIERSALANKIWASDPNLAFPTGGWIELSHGNLDTRFGVYSSTEDELIANWEDGRLYHLSMKFDYAKSVGSRKGNLLWTSFYQDLGLNDDRLANGVEWATSLSTTYGQGPWEVSLEAVYGNNGDQADASREGDFWGIIVIPSYWLIEKRLELVGRYHFQGSEESQGSRLNSRYSRRAETAGVADLNGGRGDLHHSGYLGLNYYLSGDNLKIMAGLQYDDMNREGNDVYEGWTTLFSLRTFF